MIPKVTNSRLQIFMGHWPVVIFTGALLGLATLIIFRLPTKWIPYLLLGLLFPFVLLISGYPKKILLSLILLDIPLQLDKSLKYSWILESTGSINGFIVSITTICLVFLYVFWVLEYLVKRDSITKPLKYPDKFLTLYLGVSFFSMFVAELTMVAAFEVFLMLQIYFLLFYIINNVESRADLLFVVVMLLVGLIMESLIIILVQVSGQGFGIPGLVANVYANAATSEGTARIGGTLVSANTAGSYISLLLAPAASILLTRLKMPYKWLAGFAAITAAISLILTGSRGGWLATFLSFIIFGFVSIRKGWLNIKIIVIIAFVGILISLVFFSTIYERIFGYDAAAAASRIPQYQIALRIIKDHPIFGVGANNYFYIQLGYLASDPDISIFRWVVHNKYLLVWAETGIFGLFFFVLFLVSTIRDGFTIVQFQNDLLSPLALSFAAAIAGQMVHMFFDVFHSRPQVQLLWVIVGLVMVMRTMPKKEFER